VEEKDPIETEDTDVEGHKLSQKISHAPDEAAADDEGEDPDVEGHKLSQKISHKFDAS
jgi:hypothetical protein